MKTLYLDIFSGLSGDMLIGALIDLGVDPERLKKELCRLNLDGYHIHVKRGHKATIEGVKFDVHLAHDHTHEHSHGGEKHTHSHAHDDKGHHHHEHDDHGHDHKEHGDEDKHQHSHSLDSGEHDHSHRRNYGQIREMINRSSLSDWVKQKSVAIFHRIAVAEGKIHGLPADEVHFHEVGAVDSIVDIVGTCIGLELLGKPRVEAGPVVEGTGWINCAHGRFPIPAPATLAILGARGIAVSQCEEPQELLTPTGAALLAEFAESFGPMQGLVAERIGFGLGTRDNKSRPNVVRAVLGEIKARGSMTLHDWEADTVTVLEVNLDDLSGEILGYLVEKALRMGALDVFHTPIQMKKNRPGVLLTILCAEEESDKFSELMLRETSTFGIRRYIAERRKLRREFVKVKTSFGEVTMKVGKLDGEVVQTAPEYESCKAVAEKAGVPLKEVYEAAIKTFERS